MNEEKHPDIVWNEQQERIDTVLKEAFPDLDELALIKAVDDWIFCQNAITDEEYIERCFAQAKDMFVCGISVGDGPEEFMDFIRPAIKAFYGKEKEELDDATVLALIRVLCEE